MNHEQPEPPHQTPGVPHGNQQPDRHEGRDDISPHAGTDPVDSTQGLPSSSPFNGLAVPPEFQIQLNHQQVTQSFPDPETSTKP